MTTTQEHIDGLISTIWHAQLDSSVTNIMVARVLDWLNGRARDLQEQIDKGKKEAEEEHAEIRRLIQTLSDAIKGVSTVADSAYARTDINARNIESLNAIVNAILEYLKTGEIPEGWGGGDPVATAVAVDVDRGQWVRGADYFAGTLNSATGMVERSHVWYMGCKYRCQVTGTASAPLWNSPDWEFEEGDPNPRLVFDGVGDSMMAFGEIKSVDCRLILYNQDATEGVSDWTIERDTGSKTEDLAWSLKDKARDFSGMIDLALTSDDNDLGYSEKATFKVTARIGNSEQAIGYLDF